MVDKSNLTPEEIELQGSIDAVLNSRSPKKLVIAGPGTGKTTLFKRLLESTPGDPSRRIVLTFINNLRNDLETDLGHLAKTHTLHSFCLGALYSNPTLRGDLSADLRCCPGLATLIRADWKILRSGEPPKFVGQMRSLAAKNDLDFYLERGNYYNAVDFDDSVYRVHRAFEAGRAGPDSYDLVLIDEYQDFNRLEAAIIDALSETSSTVIAGDDDQALYSVLRNATSEHIRALSKAGEYEVFTLPFCMRCPKAVVDAVADILAKAREIDSLENRIEKPYKHFPLVKGADSAKYPTIINVRTSVQSKKANYMGRYVANALEAIPEDEIAAAAVGGYPAALVIVARPYRDQILEHLEAGRFLIETRAESPSGIERTNGLEILKADLASNLGWRIVLHCDQPMFLSDSILATSDGHSQLCDAVPEPYRNTVLEEVADFEVVDGAAPSGVPMEDSPEPGRLVVRVTSFEGAKGLSAQHVFIAGLHDGELPANPSGIKDLEICKFVVGLTRTRKRCYFIHSGRFGTGWKRPSCFIDWIAAERLENVLVDKEYWKR